MRLIKVSRFFTEPKEEAISCSIVTFLLFDDDISDISAEIIVVD